MKQSREESREFTRDHDGPGALPRGAGVLSREVDAESSLVWLPSEACLGGSAGRQGGQEASVCM